MSIIVNTPLHLKDRSLLTKKYIDLTLTPLSQSTPKAHMLSSRPFIPKSTFFSLPQRSHRNLKSPKTFDLPDHTSSHLLRLTNTRSTKSSILSSFQTRPQFPPKQGYPTRLNLHTRTQSDSIPILLPSTTSNSNHLTPRRLQGYNFSQLNRNRAIIKSKFLSKLN